MPKSVAQAGCTHYQFDCPSCGRLVFGWVTEGNQPPKYCTWVCRGGPRWIDGKPNPEFSTK